MSTVATNTCSNPECPAQYELTGENAAVFVFTRHPDCNHLDTTCPECGTTQYVFLVDEGIEPLLQSGLPLRLIALPPSPQFQALADAWWDRPTPAPPAPPRDALRSLYDDLRAFERPHTPGCGCGL